MNPELGDIQPPAAQRPKASAEHLLWDEQLKDPAPPRSFLSQVFDTTIFIAGIMGNALAVGVVVLAVVSLFW